MTTISQSDDHQDDPLVESLLDELIGGVSPPDLTAQILARLKKSSARIEDPQLDLLAEKAMEDARHGMSASGAAEANKTAAPDADSDAIPFDGIDTLVVANRERLRGRGTARRRAIWWLVGGGVCASLVWVGLGDWNQRTSPSSADVAIDASKDETRNNQVTGGTSPTAGGIRPSVASNNKSRPAAGPDRSVTPPVVDPAVSPSQEQVVRDDSSPTPPPRLEHQSGGEDAEPLERPSVETQIARAPASGDAIVERIDRELASRWKLAQVTPSVPVKDEVWCQRVFQRLVGREPLAAERRAFQRNESPDKRRELVDQILTEPKYRREYAEHWSKLWTTWLVGDASKNYQTGLQRYLRESLVDGQPYDRLLISLLTAEGSNGTSDADHNGATNYLLALADGGEPKMVAELCRVALGQRTDCARCHDSTVSDLKQDQFWQMAAIFEGLKIETTRPGRHRITYDKSLATQVTFAFPEAPRKAFEPAYLDGTSLTSGSSTRDLREALGDRMVQSPEMSRAVVNRLWAQVFEYGFTFPVDDMGSHNPSELGDLLDYLAAQFSAHDYQLDSLLRWMLLSDPMTRSATLTAGNQSDFPDAGGPPLFSWYYDRSPFLFASADQGLRRLADGNAPNVTSSTLENTNKLLNARRAQDLQKPEATGQLDTSESVMGRLVPVGYLRLVRSLNTKDLSPEAKLEHAFRIVLHREPTKDERATAAKIFESAGGDSVVAMERIFWALINAR